MSAATRPPVRFSAQAPLWTRPASAAQTHRNERCHATADVLPRGDGEGADVPENMERDLANMEIMKKQSKWAQQL